MSIPISVEADDRTWEIPVIVRAVDEKTIEKDLNCLRIEVWRLASVDLLEALRIVNTISRVIGRPL
ncbi:MAG: hypothetical protein Q8R29_02585 [bacterium]|nr:hypothetical protein [bacterium]